MATRKLTVEILGDARSLERAFKTSGKEGTQWGTAIKRAGILAAAGVAAFALTATKVVNASSNLNEQINRSNVVFGKNATAIRKWSETTADAFAISQREALEAAAGFGSMLQTAGITEKASASMAKSIVELAGDMASFNNISTTEALDKLRAGLAGEAEPLRRYSVFLSDAAVKTEAYTSGIAKQGAELTEAQKVQARYNIILQQTSKQQGDASRTSDSFANSMRRIRAQIEDNAAKIGNKLLPVVGRTVDAIADMIDDLGAARTIGAKFDIVVENITGLARSLTSQISEVISKINWSKVFDRAEGIVEGLEERLAETDFSAVGKRIGDAFSDAAKVALPAAAQIADRVAAAVREVDWEKLGKAMGPGLATAVTVAFTTLLDPAFWLRNWDLALAVALVAAGGPIAKFAGRFAGLLVSGIARGLERLSPALGAAFRGLAIQAVRLFGAGLSVLQRVLARVLAPLVGVVRGVFRRLGRLATFTVKVLGIQAVVNLITELAADVRRVFSRLGGFIGDVFRDAIRKVLEFVNKVLGVTSILGRFDPFKGLREKVQKQLKAMEADVSDTVDTIGTTMGRIKDKTVRIALEVQIRTTTIGGGRRPEEGVPSAEVVPEDIDRATRALGARYNAMAAAYARYNAEQARLAAAATAARNKAAADRKREAARLKKARERQRKAFEAVMEALELDVDIAVDVGAFKRALAAMREVEQTILKQISIEGRTTELLRRLHTVREAQKQLLKDLDEQAKEAATARQFRALGLTAAGEKPPPTIENLIKQWQNLNKRIEGTTLERKFGSTMDKVIKVLRNKTDKATDEIRAWVRDFFEEVRGGFKEGGDTIAHTAAQALNANKIMQGLGLSPEEMRKLRGRLSQFTMPGVTLAPATRATAVGAIVGGPSPVTIENTIYLDGAVIARSTKRFMDNDRIHNPRQKRGPNAGR